MTKPLHAVLLSIIFTGVFQGDSEMSWNAAKYFVISVSTRKERESSSASNIQHFAVSQGQHQSSWQEDYLEKHLHYDTLLYTLNIKRFREEFQMLHWNGSWSPIYDTFSEWTNVELGQDSSFSKVSERRGQFYCSMVNETKTSHLRQTGA